MNVGMALFILGAFLLLLGFIVSLSGMRGSNVRGGGVVLIGPIPVVFGSDWKVAAVLLSLSIVVILLWFVLLR